ncbi:MAG: hypothetical protein KC620_20630, partial [Myxococcales bacterium]|nr:hypothetical protein [Myxococcales bacterium]
EISLAATPDLFPPLVALAAVAPGLTVFTDAPGLRHKECDRIAAMAAGLAALGIEATERPDGLIVNGGRPRPGSVHSHDDHRVHMAFAALAARFPGIAVDGRGCEAVSYPGFHADLARITG